MPIESIQHTKRELSCSLVKKVHLFLDIMFSCLTCSPAYNQTGRLYSFFLTFWHRTSSETIDLIEWYGLLHIIICATNTCFVLLSHCNVARFGEMLVKDLVMIILDQVAFNKRFLCDFISLLFFFCFLSSYILVSISIGFFFVFVLFHARFPPNNPRWTSTLHWGRNGLIRPSNHHTLPLDYCLSFLLFFRMLITKRTSDLSP